MNSLYIRRVLFDNVYEWFIAILLVQMTAGIIIDTFKSLNAET